MKYRLLVIINLEVLCGFVEFFNGTMGVVGISWGEMGEDLRSVYSLPHEGAMRESETRFIGVNANNVVSGVLLVPQIPG